MGRGRALAGSEGSWVAMRLRKTPPNPGCLTDGRGSLANAPFPPSDQEEALGPGSAS